MVTKMEAARQAAQILREGHAAAALLTPEEAARRAWHPGGPSLETLIAEITASRAKVVSG